MEPLRPAGRFFVAAMTLYTPSLIQRLHRVIFALAPQWGFTGGVNVKLLNISENATFLLEAGKNRRVIRAYRPFYHRDEEILSELQWMQALEHENIIRLPHVFPTQDGALFITEALDDIHWRFAAFSYLEGEEPKVDSNLIGRFSQLGEIAARLHVQTDSWQLPHTFIRKHWTFDTIVGVKAYWGDWRKAPSLSNADIKLLENCAPFLEKTEKSFPRDGHFGLIHGDLRLANLLVDGKTLATIDFDDCGFSWRATDLANSISFIEDSPLVPDLIHAWLEGYAKITSPHTIQMMTPHLMMMRRMQLSAWLAGHSEIPTAQTLGFTFHQKTVSLAKKYLKTYS